ncbi:MAG: tetratricopeptide repeat protein [Fuerstia sp.]|nr:tetratricopeptide repeat protein [Fuerstiella sp.]
MSFYQKWMRSFRYWSRSVRLPRLPRILTFGFYWSIIAFPFAWLMTNWQHHRVRDLLLGTPALAAAIAAAVLLGNAQFQSRSLTTSYFNEAQKAIAEQDYPRAELLLSRVLQRGDGRLSDARYLMAVLFDEMGQKERASALLRIIAPDDSQGNRDAHRRLAMILANQTTFRSDPAEIKRLNWHLLAARDDTSPEMAMAWGQYYLAVGELNSARRYLEVAAKAFPEVWQTLGVIEVTVGNAPLATSHFQRSADYLSEKLRVDPKDEQSRVDYAQVLMKLGRLDDARITLEQGKLLNPDGKWSWLLASLAVGYHDLNASTGKPISELLGYLDRALTYDPNHGPALNRLMAYAKADVTGNVELKTVLARVIAEGEQPALAHLAMGNLCWLENDRSGAMFHFERAVEIRNDVAVLLNNLAWLVAHDKDAPDLERAMALINSALEKSPEDPRFLDTRGTIFFLQKDWKPALVDLEKALTGVRDKRAVHEKLATIYQELGMKEISEQHTKLSEELMNAPAPQAPQAQK